MNRVELFDTWAVSYDKTLSGEQAFPFAGYEQVLAEVIKAAGLSPNMRVLDVGTGTGNLAAALVQDGCDVWGCDYSLAMLEQAKQKVPKASFFQLDLLADSLTFPQTFERIVSTYVLHEFDLPTKLSILTRLSNYLLSGGFIVIGDIAFPDQETHDAARERYQNHWDTSEHYWIAEETRAACAEVGLELRYAQVSSCAAVMVFK